MKKTRGMKNLAGLILLILALLANGCGGGSSETSSSAGTTTGTSTAAESILFKLDSIAAVSNNPPNKTVFTLSSSTHITKIFTYHWNGGSGDTPGTIGLKDTATGAVIGTWNAVGTKSGVDVTPGATWPTTSNGPPYLYWIVQPNVDVPAGTYEVVDSKPATWSYTSDTGNKGIAWVFGEASTTGISYIQGDMVGQDAFYIQMSESVSKTSGALLQAILAVNSFLFTDFSNTTIETVRNRKAEADKALTILEQYATETESLITQKESTASLYQKMIAAAISPEDVLATVSSGPANKQIKTLMTTYNVNAKRAQLILNTAMAGLESSNWNDEAELNNKAAQTATLIKEGAGLSLTVIGSVVTAGGVTGALGVADAAVTLITGADGVIKVTKAGIELVTGKDISQPGGTVGAIITGLSDTSEIIGFTSLKKWTDSPDIISNVYNIALKANDALQDKQINLGAHTFDIKQSDPATVSQAKGSNDIPTTLTGKYNVSGNKVEVKTLPESVTNVIDKLPDSNKIDSVNTTASVTLQSIAVTPATTSITNGSTQQFTATGTYTDGISKNITASAAWSSSNTAFATIDASGLATGVAVGTATITASSGSVSGSTTLTVTASAATTTFAHTEWRTTFTGGQSQSIVFNEPTYSIYVGIGTDYHFSLISGGNYISTGNTATLTPWGSGSPSFVVTIEGDKFKYWGATYTKVE